MTGGPSAQVAGSPLAATLAAAEVHGVGLPIGVPDGPGWVSAQHLTRDADALRGALECAGAALGTPRADIGATRLCEVWTWSLAAPAAATLLLDGRLPDLRAPNVTLRLTGDPSGCAVALVDGRFHALHTDPAAGHPDARVACGEQALLARLNTDLVDHLGPLVEQLNARSGRPRAALWRSAADRLAGAFLWLGEALGCESRARELARRAVGFGPPLAGRARTQPVGERHVPLRDGCCLYYRVPGATTCLSCPLVDEDERARRALAQG